jgi:glutamate-1-semialdehyde 2,1-aminomutase
LWEYHAASRLKNSTDATMFTHQEEPVIDRDYRQLLAELADDYARHAPRSQELQARARASLVDGGSHALRLIAPFPPRITAARGSWLEDEDGHHILDFWQGHMANVLGHNPQVVTEVLARSFEERFGLQTGFTDRLQIETAEILCRQTGAERVRFTTSGTLGTMYAIMLARAYTKRRMVMKVGGGWHGAQPWALKGIRFVAEQELGFQGIESAGVPQSVTDRVVVSNFNDPERLASHFREYGDQLACFIVEPFMGAGGNMAATPEYLRAARDLTEQYGVLLIFDEVVAGFRFRAGNLGALYDIQPDLTTFGKVIGGGMPVAAVAGRADIMELVAQGAASPVKFSGGTYSAHPASLLAARTMMSYLAEHEDELYPRLATLGAATRRLLEDTLQAEGIYAVCSGGCEDVLPGSSMFMLHFPYQEGVRPTTPAECFNPAACDVTLAHKVLDLALLLEDVFFLHSHGALSTAHTEDDLEFLAGAIRRAARRIKPHL